ncbi:MAG TPA: bifunctional DNA-binding transcriptional regulator/O6-methylguanine-DNA methyltransferase Ada [Planctomycetota bacterium]|nr:bifunctional DNA-binding transcriptional regulator/O6-methylguanine-DNA methyltransferase Ada [Planctomycetota bacterium]
METQTLTHFSTEDTRWLAVSRRDRSAGNTFVYSVKTTGVYCRPGCPSRLPRRENIRFHDTPADARRAGFRACKRCRPDGEVTHHPAREAVIAACRLLERGDAPDMDAVARESGMSASHFHRTFKAVIGLTPKAYAQARRAERVRDELSRNATVTAAMYRAGFNSTSRFYASSAKTLGMPPKTFRDRGKGASIRFAIGECSLGAILVAATDIGICAISLGDDPETLLSDFQRRFSRATLIGADRRFEKLIARVIAMVEQPRKRLDLPLDLQGTIFQQRVWRALQDIPPGATSTYTKIAQRLGLPNAVRAVARACASNQLAVAIPCHRVIRTDGSLAGYRWGIKRKRELLKRERWSGVQR